MDKTHVYRFSNSPEEVAAIMANPDFHYEFDRTREDASGTEMRPREPNGDILEFTMLTQEFRHTKTGGLNRNKTTEGRTDFRWNGGTKILDWQYYSGEDPKRINIRGRYLVQPDGQGSRLVHEYSIDIKIPLIGGQVSKLVGKEFIKSFPKFEAAVRSWLAR